MGDTGTARRLLVLSCTQRKRPDPGLLPAIDRYDGPFFRVLRRYQRGVGRVEYEGKSLPDVYVLSAEHGLISSEQPIANYERRMTMQRADELRPRVLADLSTILDANTDRRELFICMGRDYLFALEGWKAQHPSGLVVIQAEGSIGGRQAQLHDWLYGAPPSKPTAASTGKAIIRGVEVQMTAEEVFAVMHQALNSDGMNAVGFHKWYVQLDDQRVAPKWLVSQLTGLPVSAFATDDARRFLACLGVEVMRA